VTGSTSSTLDAHRGGFIDARPLTLA